MIAEIHNSGKKTYFVARYLFDKVNKNLGYVLLNSTSIPHNELNHSSLNDEFSRIKELNKRSRNTYQHISINLPHFDSIDDNTWRSLVIDYLNGMGYSDCPFVAIAHTDSHPHVHILVTTVNHHGISINTSHNFHKSFFLSRNLEKKYNLSVLPELSNRENIIKYSLSERNRDKFSFRNAFVKAYKSDKLKSNIVNIVVSKKHINKFLYNKNITNSEALSILGEDTYHKLIDFFSSKHLLNKTYKEDLIDFLSNVLNSSTSFDSFIDNIKSNGYYVRYMTKSGIPKFSYGIPSLNFYISEDQLPLEFSFSKLSSKFGPPSSKVKGKSYFKSTLYEDYYDTLSTSYTVDEFLKNLSKKGYHVSLDKDSLGSFIKISIPNTSYSFTDRELSKSFTLKKLFSHQIRNTFYECLSGSKSFMEFTIKLRKQGIDIYFNSRTKKVVLRDLNLNISIPISYISNNLSYDKLKVSFSKYSKHEMKMPLYPLRYATFNPSKNHTLKPFYDKKIDKHLDNGISI